MITPPFALEVALRGGRFVATHASEIVGIVARHTGIPAVVVVGLSLAASFRIVKKTARFLVEVGVAVVLVFAAVRMGWVRF